VVRASRFAHTMLVAAVVVATSPAATAQRPPVVEIAQAWTFGIGDPFIERWGLTFGAKSFLRSYFAVGVEGTGYPNSSNSETDFAFETRRATRVPHLIEEDAWQGELTLTCVVLSSKPSVVQVDAYVVGGFGIISSRPIPVIDPDHRAFGFKVNPSFGGGVGGRLLLARWVGFTFEVHDYPYIGRHEATTVATNSGDPATWYGPIALIDNVQLQFGVSIVIH
jgi:hypothetical protein